MLYHGTSERFLDKIKREGLVPRIKTKQKGHWAHTVQSNPRAIYLTDAYPFHFAFNAGSDERGLILEIDRDLLLPWVLCPDEDALEQGTRKVEPTKTNNMAPTEWSMLQRTRYYRKLARENPQLADASLEMMGTAAYYGTIPFQAITRYVLVEWPKLPPVMYFGAVDTMVSCLNYRILKERHRALVKWFFNDPVEPIELTTWAGIDLEGQEVPDMMKKQIESIAEQVQDRKGLTNVNCKEVINA